MHEVRACGVFVTVGSPIEKFLLLKHPHRYDLPKGHVEAGETDEQCALRELWEGTGIPADAIELDAHFRFQTDYQLRYRSLNHELAHKTVVIYLARLLRDIPLKLTEHDGYEWFRWAPPHSIQAQTIDPLLQAVAKHFSPE